MLKRSRRIWIGVAAACAAAVTPSVILAQEYLPPVIDRSSAVGQRAPAPAQRQAVDAQTALSLEQRVKKLERLLDNQALVDMLMRLDAIQTDMQGMQGDVETLGHTLEGIKQRQRDLYLDMDRRLRQVEQAASQQSAPGVSSTSGMAAPIAAAASVPVMAAPSMGTSATSAAVAPADPAAERDAYQKAFNLLKEGRYDQAITAFQGFLASYPSGDYTDNAQYWLGEANYVTRRFNEAEQEFLKVLNLHPDSTKVSDAMLKLGYTYYEIGNWSAARKTLDNVVSRFPNTTVGRLAENRLQKMRLEGR